MNKPLIFLLVKNQYIIHQELLCGKKMVLWWIYLLKKWFCGGFTFKKNGFVVDLTLKKRALPTCDWVKENFEEVGKSVFTNSLKK